MPSATDLEDRSGRSGVDELAPSGYRQELRRSLSFFSNFGVALTDLSPVVGIYSLFALGIGSPRADLFNYGRMTLVVMFVILVIGAVVYFAHWPHLRGGGEVKEVSPSES